jgi:hypothetical protein
MPTLRIAVAAAALSAITLGLPAAAQDPTFGGDELKKAWTDKELMGRGRNGVTFYMSFRADGTATFAAGINDTGIWRATDTGYCARWQRIREGKEGCFVVRRNGGSFIVFSEDGSESGRIHNVR